MFLKALESSSYECKMIKKSNETHNYQQVSQVNKQRFFIKRDLKQNQKAEQFYSLYSTLPFLQKDN